MRHSLSFLLSITASDGVATQPRLNHKLGVRYDPFYLGCIGATAEVERKPDASESSQLPTFRATAAVDLRNVLLLYLHFTDIIIVILIRILMHTQFCNINYRDLILHEKKNKICMLMSYIEYVIHKKLL